MLTRITSLVKNALSKSLTRLFTAEKFDFGPVLLQKERLLNPNRITDFNYPEMSETSPLMLSVLKVR